MAFELAPLKDFVTVVRDLPIELMESYNFSISNIPSIRVEALSSARYYLDEVYAVLQETRLARSIPPHIQFLRCFANYKALRKIVKRMTDKGLSSEGKYVSVHLRFEEDMVAFSCCVYDGGDRETLDMDAIRQKGWGKNFLQKNRIYKPGDNRVNGRCSMTPVEVGMMLRGMGFSNNTSIYLASGEIYKDERYLWPLREMFMFLETKESLATADELASFKRINDEKTPLLKPDKRESM